MNNLWCAVKKFLRHQFGLPAKFDTFDHLGFKAFLERVKDSQLDCDGNIKPVYKIEWRRFNGFLSSNQEVAVSFLTDLIGIDGQPMQRYCGTCFSYDGNRSIEIDAYIQNAINEILNSCPCDGERKPAEKSSVWTSSPVVIVGPYEQAKGGTE